MVAGVNIAIFEVATVVVGMNIAIFEVATMVAGVNIAIFGVATVVVGANIAIFGVNSVVKVISRQQMLECNATTDTNVFLDFGRRFFIH